MRDGTRLYAPRTAEELETSKVWLSSKYPQYWFDVLLGKEDLDIVDYV